MEYNIAYRLLLHHIVVALTDTAQKTHHGEIKRGEHEIKRGEQGGTPSVSLLQPGGNQMASNKQRRERKFGQNRGRATAYYCCQPATTDFRNLVQNNVQVLYQRLMALVEKVADTSESGGQLRLWAKSSSCPLFEQQKPAQRTKLQFDMHSVNIDWQDLRVQLLPFGPLSLRERSRQWPHKKDYLFSSRRTEFGVRC